MRRNLPSGLSTMMHDLGWNETFSKKVEHLRMCRQNIVHFAVNEWMNEWILVSFIEKIPSADIHVMSCNL